MKSPEQELLLVIARKTLEAYFHQEKYDLEKIPELFKLKRGVFVTLHKKKELRGCIGYIQPIKSIYQGVKENVLNAAFKDPRFSPLQEEELKEIQIEISLLSVPQKLEFKEPLELIKKLRPKIDGVILERDGHQATFLPQVWEELSDPYDFLRQLSWKAGLHIEAWKSATIFTYQAEVFKE